MMRDMEEMIDPELAAALGLTVEAVKSRLSRG
jgi:DNA-directed RNA polymerase specialized sigma24 family protein